MASHAAGGDAYQPLERMLQRFDPGAFDAPPGESRVRLLVRDGADECWDVLLHGGRDHVQLIKGAPRRRPDALLSADRSTWWQISHDVGAGLDAYRSGKLDARYNLHLAVGLLAATAAKRPGRLEVKLQDATGHRLSTMQAGRGDAVVLLHGLGATKASFLPTIRALAQTHRVVALDLPGFGDAHKPMRAAYDAKFFARFVVDAMDRLGFRRAHVVGHSMGGRVALELGMEHPDRVQSLSLMTPSLAWRRARPWAPYLRFIRPELGVIQVAPRAVVDPLVRRLIPGGTNGWTAVGVDEFLRAFLNPRGRAAFYAAARNIYLEKPSGPGGFWERLPGVQAPSLFIWGKRDRIVPMAFRRHVERAVPHAHHAELDCAHVPQFECAEQLHTALTGFLASHPVTADTHGSLARSR